MTLSGEMLPHQRAVISWSLAGVHSLPATNCLQKHRTFSFTSEKMIARVDEPPTGGQLPRVGGSLILFIFFYFIYYKIVSHYVALTLMEFTL